MIPTQRLNAEEERELRSRERSEMTTQLQRPTAKIYAFPAGGRAPPKGYRTKAMPSPHVTSLRAAAEPAPHIVYGSSWYHQEAVDEAEDSLTR